MSFMFSRGTGRLLLVAALALAGCSGSTGDTGPMGPTGATGPSGPSGPPGEPPQAKLEQCAGCHNGSLASKHALSDQLGVVVTYPVTPAIAVVNTNDVTVTFRVSVNGVPRFDFNRSASVARNHNEDATWYYVTDPATCTATAAQLPPNDTGPTGCRPKITQGSWSIATYQNGNVVVTIPNFVPTYGLRDGQAIMLSVMNPQGATATAVAYYNGRVHDLVSDQACINCHGQLVWRDAAHDVTFPQGVGPCIVCHSRKGAADPRLPGAGSGLMGIVHGIHNSKNMADGTYQFTWTNGNKFNFSVGFPGNMNNCATCHATTAELAAVSNTPVAYGTCISCHDGWGGFGVANTGTEAAPVYEFGGVDHAGFDATTTCGTCHTGARATIKRYHDGLITERAGLIWDGADQSVVLGKDYALEITGITVSGTNLVVTWTAKNPNTGTPYDPCNQDFATGPVFFGYTSPLNRTEGCVHTAGGCNSNFDFLQSFAQAGDWVNDGLVGSSAPGQPAGNVKPQATNAAADGYTTCDATTKVATTNVARKTTTATKGILAIEGKPQQRFTASNTIIQVRATTPTREFVVTDGTVPAAQRRTLVDVSKCNACHLGTLYQHGGSRVDSIELCVMCHNPASSEQNRRVGMGVTAAEAYDGLAGQTYDLRYMVHAIHSAFAEYGASPGYDPTTHEQIRGPLLRTGKPLMFYRSNGIFFFGSQPALEQMETWPLNGAADQCISCVDVEDGPLTYCKVYGSSATGDKPVRNNDGTCGTPVASTDGTWRPHRVVEVHYPRPLQDCGACHVDGAVDMVPDPTQAVAVTYDTGASTTYNVLIDDVLMGPSAASCMSCHRSGDSALEFGLRSHANGFGFAPAVFPDGRQTLIDAAAP